MSAQNVARLRPKWQGVLGGLVDYSSPAVADGVLYIGSTDGRLYAFDANGCGRSECGPLWTGQGQAGGDITSSPAVSNGMVYVDRTHMSYWCSPQRDAALRNARPCGPGR